MIRRQRPIAHLRVGHGTSLALVGTYVLAGELAAAEGGDHRAAFERYEREMREYVRRGQEQVKGASGFLLPKSRPQVWLRNQFIRMLPYMPWKGMIAGGPEGGQRDHAQGLRAESPVYRRRMIDPARNRLEVVCLQARRPWYAVHDPAPLLYAAIRRGRYPDGCAKIASSWAYSRADSYEILQTGFLELRLEAKFVGSPFYEVR